MSAPAGRRMLVGAAALLTLLSGIVAVEQAEGQQQPHRAWVALGLGAGGRFDDGGGFGVMGEAVYERRPDHYALRALGVGSPEDRGPGFAEIGVLYGRFVSGDDAHASAAAGLSAVFLEECDETHNECTTFGIPLKLEVALVPVPVIGIGLQVFGNLNPEQPYVGLFVTLPLGWMP